MSIVDKENGVRADGYARVEMTFNGSVNIRQVGHAILHIDRHDEDYLIPLPDVKVRGFLSGCMYPEILGPHTIVSSSGFVTELNFSGEGVIRGKRNSFEARIYRKDDPKKKSIYEVAGVWSDGWTVKDSRTGEVLEKYKIDAPENGPVPISITPIEQQDPWESRRAWAGVLNGMAAGDMRQVVAEKTRIEEAQRQMRALEKASGDKFEPLLFRSIREKDHAVFQRLAEGTEWKLQADKTKGVWLVDDSKAGNLQRPYRGELTPLGQ